MQSGRGRLLRQSHFSSVLCIWAELCLLQGETALHLSRPATATLPAPIFLSFLLPPTTSPPSPNTHTDSIYSWLLHPPLSFHFTLTQSPNQELGCRWNSPRLPFRLNKKQKPREQSDGAREGQLVPFWKLLIYMLIAVCVCNSNRFVYNLSCHFEEGGSREM